MPYLNVRKLSWVVEVSVEVMVRVLMWPEIPEDCALAALVPVGRTAHHDSSCLLWCLGKLSLVRKCLIHKLLKYCRSICQPKMKYGTCTYHILSEKWLDPCPQAPVVDGEIPVRCPIW